MSFPLTSSCEAFIVCDSCGIRSVERIEKYAPAENKAAEFFQRAMPDTLKETAGYLTDALAYFRTYAHLADDPVNFPPESYQRFEQLGDMLKSCSEPDSGQIADEACSLVASLVLRFAPDEDVSLKFPEVPPRNVPEMMACFAGLKMRLPHAAALLSEALQVDLKRTDSRSIIMALYQKALDGDPTYFSERKARRYGASGDELISAGRGALSAGGDVSDAFDGVRRRMLPE